MATLKYKDGDSWIDVLHPAGSFYFSNSNESPAVLFGGTWTQVTGAAIRGDSSTGYTGSDTCTLTVNEIPAHTHYFRVNAFGHQGNTTTSREPVYWDAGSYDGTIWTGGLGNNSNVEVSGGGRIPTFSAPITAISGTEQHNFSSFGGEVICLGLIFLT